jgi:hypothetical protein
MSQISAELSADLAKNIYALTKEKTKKKCTSRIKPSLPEYLYFR